MELIGADLGGTAIKLGRFDAGGACLAELECPTPQPALPGAVSMALVEAITAVDPEGKADRVGIGLPGPMDRSGRVARVSINLPGWHDVPLADWLEPQLERRVILANDANCALLGEAWLGAARGRSDVLLLTLGTGVGGAALLGGQLFTGRDGAAIEPGLIGIDPEGPPAAAETGARSSSSAASRGWAASARWIQPSSAAAPTGVIPKPWPSGTATAAGWGSV